MDFHTKVALAINDVVDKETPWDDIVKEIDKRKIKVSNWMKVRGVLQWMMDEKIIRRNAFIDKEVYSTY